MNEVLNETRFVAADSQADYDAWLIKEVQESIDDPRPSVSHAVAVAEWEEQARGIRARMAEMAEV
jgi:hypothetical protein